MVRRRASTYIWWQSDPMQQKIVHTSRILPWWQERPSWWVLRSALAILWERMQAEIYRCLKYSVVASSCWKGRGSGCEWSYPPCNGGDHEYNCLSIDLDNVVDKPVHWKSSVARQGTSTNPPCIAPQGTLPSTLLKTRLMPTLEQALCTITQTSPTMAYNAVIHANT